MPKISTLEVNYKLKIMKSVVSIIYNFDSKNNTAWSVLNYSEYVVICTKCKTRAAKLDYVCTSSYKAVCNVH